MGQDEIVAQSFSQSLGRRRSDRIVGASPAMQQAIQQASTAAKSKLPVVISGPAGSGREFLANAIHAWGEDTKGPFTVLTASALPEGLQMRELFGCAAGIHRMVPAAYQGVLQRAAGGTVVLDGAFALRHDVRDALLQAMQEGSFSPEGDRQKIDFDTRIVVINEGDLGNFFKDLPSHSIQLTPLSQRKEDILPLATHFLSVFAEEAGLSATGFAPDARQALIEGDWPGNVHELRERIRQAVTLSRGGAISVEALALASDQQDVPSFKEAKRAFETRYVESLLVRCSGNISRAARLAKKDRKDFYDVIRRTGVDPQQFRS